MPARPLCFVLLLVLAGCDASPIQAPNPPAVLNWSVTPNPVRAGAPLRVEVTVEDSTGVTYSIISVSRDRPAFGGGSRYSRFTLTAPADTGRYGMALEAVRHGEPRIIQFSLTVVP